MLIYKGNKVCLLNIVVSVSSELFMSGTICFKKSELGLYQMSIIFVLTLLCLPLTQVSLMFV